MDEIWKDIKGYEGLYQISNLGNVKSLKNNKNRKLFINKTGYVQVDLYNEGVEELKLVHRLVAQVFIPNPNNLPQVNHKDENKNNNCVDNLEWCTSKYNMNYGVGAKTRHSKIDYSSQKRKEIARKNGKNASKPVLQIKNGKIVNKFSSGAEASRKTNTSHSHILECCNQKRKTAGGYIWEFNNNERRNDLSV